MMLYISRGSLINGEFRVLLLKIEKLLYCHGFWIINLKEFNVFPIQEICLHEVNEGRGMSRAVTFVFGIQGAF